MESGPHFQISLTRLAESFVDAKTRPTRGNMNEIDTGSCSKPGGFVRYSCESEWQP